MTKVKSEYREYRYNWDKKKSAVFIDTDSSVDPVPYT